MPASYYNSGGLALRPIITPAQTDPLELAIKQAQLRNLQLQPQQADREFQQRQQQLAQTSALEQRGQDVTQRGQDVTSQDSANQVQVQRENIATQLAIHHETSQNALTEAYLAHAYANGIEPATLADILKQRGSPEYANALLTAHKQKATDAAQGLALGLDAATKSGNPQDIQAAIGAIKSKGQDYVDAVKPLVPKEYHPLFEPGDGTGATLPISTAPVSFATKIGRFIKHSADFNSPDAVEARRVEQRQRISKLGGDFYAGLSGQ